jgi:hypothetical protein
MLAATADGEAADAIELLRSAIRKAPLPRPRRRRTARIITILLIAAALFTWVSGWVLAAKAPLSFDATIENPAQKNAATELNKPFWALSEGQPNYRESSPIHDSFARSASAERNMQAPPGAAAYRDGWQDGCVSAHFASGDINHLWKHDVARSTFDKLYKSGWTHGFMACADRSIYTIKLPAS